MAIDVHSNRHLDEELVTLRRLLFEMSELVDEQVAGAIDAVSNCDVELAHRVRERDDEVDKLELDVDHQCERILALFTPVAVDLRLIISAVKVNTDLERIGDHAKNLAKNTQKLERCLDLIEKTRIREMADEARGMLHEAQDAFMKQDRVLAREVLAHDRHVDRLHDETLKTIAGIIRAQPERADEIVHLVNMSKSVERIADHAKNIAELVVFLVEGVDIRHRGAQAAAAEEAGNETS
ncbi:MAG: phosphate signaling complex protein PhoU [Rhodothermales bacterium]